METGRKPKSSQKSGFIWGPKFGHFPLDLLTKFRFTLRSKICTHILIKAYTRRIADVPDFAQLMLVL